ncbi:MAG TPA: HAMP domain-containing protein, partial [Candidatus Acidoferrum sp.]|nr:HAMP domain-containing protein [Candidatus Acidoferrum sp.]
MKSRLSSTIRMLIAGTTVALFAVLGLAYHAGKESGGIALADAPALPSSASGPLFAAFGLAIAAALLLMFVLSKRVLKPVGELGKFSERLAAGDARARADFDSGDDFGLIAENLNRSAAKVAHA